MRYMMFIKHPKDYGDVHPPASLYEEMGQFIGEATRDGHFISGGGLQPLAAGTRVKLKSGTITVMDGPFAEAKEVVGGYAIMDFASRDQAIALTTRFMEVHRKHWPEFEGECELRPLEEEVQPTS